MTLSIITKGSAAPAYAPVFGNLVHTGNLKFAIRANSKANFFDLSDEEHTLNVLPNTKLLLTPKGINTFGAGNDGLNTGIQVTDLLATQLDDHTLMGVISIPSLSIGVNIISAWAFGDYISATAYRGIGVFLRVVPNGDSTASVLLRAGFSGALKTTGAVAGSFIDVPYLTNVPLTSLTDVKPMFFMARQKTLSGTNYLDVKILSSNLATTTTNTTNDLSGAAKASVLASAGISPRPIKIGSAYASNAIDDSLSTAIDIKEARLDSVALTDQQIEDQYQATKKWLLAEGVLDISHWR